MTNYKCADCNTPIKLNQKYCKQCGTELIWNVSDGSEESIKRKFKRLGFGLICFFIIIFYIGAVSSGSFMSLVYSILLILPIWFFADKENKKTNIRNMFLRISNFWKKHRIRTIISGILFLILFIFGLTSAIGNSLQERNAFVEKQAYENAPTPVIQILSQSGNLGNITGYTLIYKTKDATEVTIITTSSQTFFGNDEEKSINFSLEGVGNHTLVISIFAKNEYKSAEKKLTITRTKTAQEIKMEREENLRIEREQKAEKDRIAKEQKAETAQKLQEESSNRQQYASLMRERYLDAGLDIKVSVKGKYNTTLALTYVLMGDVTVHQLRKTQELEWEGMGFARVDFYDGYGYHAWLIF